MPYRIDFLELLRRLPGSFNVIMAEQSEGDLQYVRCQTAAEWYANGTVSDFERKVVRIRPIPDPVEPKWCVYLGSEEEGVPSPASNYLTVGSVVDLLPPFTKLDIRTGELNTVFMTVITKLEDPPENVKKLEVETLYLLYDNDGLDYKVELMCPSTLKHELQNNIKQRRTELGLTQKQLAAMVGIASNNLSRIEIGAAVPSAEIAALLCSALRCNFEDIFHIEEVPPNGEEREKVLFFVRYEE